VEHEIRKRRLLFLNAGLSTSFDNEVYCDIAVPVVSLRVFILTFIFVVKLQFII
jgi:hypothetical protein